MATNWTSGFEDGLGQTMWNGSEKWWSSGADEYGNSTGWTNGTITSQSPVLDSYKNSTDPWDSTWKASLLGNTTGDIGPGLEWAQKYNLNPAQSLQWYNQGVGNFQQGNLFAGAQDTLNQKLLPGYGIWNMMQQSGNLTPDVQNQLIQMVDQGDKVKEQYNAKDKADSMRAMMTFGGGLATLLTAGATGALGNITYGVQPGYIGAGLGEMGAGAAAGNGAFLGDFADMAGGDMFNIDELINWGADLGGSGDFGSFPNIEESVLNSGGTPEPYLTNDYSIPGMGQTNAPGALENAIMNQIYGQGGSGLGGSILRSGGSQLLQMLLGGGRNGFVPGGGTKGGYQPDLGAIIGALMGYKGQSDMQDRLEGYMNQAVSKADPFSPNRPESADMLMKLYRDPLSNPAMSALALNARRAMEAKDAAAGRNSQYGERETQLAGLLAGQMGQIANPLLTMSGATANPNAAANVITSMSNPIAAADIAKQGNLGYGMQSLINGQQPTLYSYLQNGNVQNQGLGGLLADLWKEYA